MLIELVEIVEDVEELFLGFFLIDDELEVVDNETIEFFELTAELFAFAVLDGVDKIGIEVRDGGVEDFVVGVALQELIADSLDEVSFAEARAAVEEEWIATRAWSVDDAFGGGSGDVVVGADDEVVESVFAVKAVVFDAAFDVVFDRLDATADGIGGNCAGDFAGADLGFDAGLDFEIYGVYFYVVFEKSIFDDVDKLGTELFDVEGVFDANDDGAAFGGEKRSVFKPSGKIGR